MGPNLGSGKENSDPRVERLAAFTKLLTDAGIEFDFGEMPAAPGEAWCELRFCKGGTTGTYQCLGIDYTALVVDFLNHGTGDVAALATKAIEEVNGGWGWWDHKLAWWTY